MAAQKPTSQGHPTPAEPVPQPQHDHIHLQFISNTQEATSRSPRTIETEQCVKADPQTIKLPTFTFKFVGATLKQCLDAASYLGYELVTQSCASMGGQHFYMQVLVTSVVLRKRL